MLYGINEKGKMVNILESIEGVEYHCPICKEKLIRCFGLERQYFSHTKDNQKDCELKLKQYLKQDKKDIELNDYEILHNEYFDKDFKDLKIEYGNLTTEEGYKLTKEQEDIINSKEDRIRIQASAGASKSYTLYRYAKARPNKRFLYLVYNSAMKDEAKELFKDLNNVDIKTTHGLAYGYVGRNYSHKLTFSYKPIDVFNDLKLEKDDFSMAVYVYNMLSQFMLSSKDSIEDMELYKDEDFKDKRSRIISLTKQLWELKSNTLNKVKVEHDFYLKKFHLMKKDLSYKYDIVMLDEAQDSNEMVFDMVKNLNTKGIIMVGDCYQAMYQFRNAINVLNLLDNATEYKLNTSFRVSQSIANISNLLLKDVYNVNFGMKGFNENNKIVDKIDTNKPYMFIARTNSTILEECIEAIKHGKTKIYFEGGYNSYKFNDILDCYNFYLGEKVKNNKFNKFKDYYQMEKYAQDNEDIELLGFIKTINDYGSRIPELIENIKNCECKSRNDMELGVCTAHKSKGATFENVKIADDFFSMEDYFNKRYIEVKQDGDNSYLKKAEEEVCVLYVAITRAKKNIQLNNDLLRYLLLRYQYFDNK